MKLFIYQYTWESYKYCVNSYAGAEKSWDKGLSNTLAFIIVCMILEARLFCWSCQFFSDALC